VFHEKVFRINIQFVKDICAMAEVVFNVFNSVTN